MYDNEEKTSYSMSVVSKRDCCDFIITLMTDTKHNLSSVFYAVKILEVVIPRIMTITVLEMEQFVFTMQMHIKLDIYV